MKVGDKYIVEIDKIFEQDGEKLYRAKGMKTLVFDNKGMRKLKPMEEYHEVFNKNMEIIRDKAFEAGQVKGQNDAWELALKLRYMDYEDKVECFGLGYDGKEKWIEVMENYTYAEAAAQVAEWKKAKEEICVGDVVECEGSYGVVVGAGEVYVKGFTSDWTPFQWMKKDCTKTGRHIDVDAWLAQIGGDCNG